LITTREQQEIRFHRGTRGPQGHQLLRRTASVAWPEPSALLSDHRYSPRTQREIRASWGGAGQLLIAARLCPVNPG
jgi:hypothetical protein